VKNEDLDKAIEHYQSKQFKLRATLPGSWKSASLKLRHAASRLRELQHDAILRILERGRAEFEAGEMREGITKLEGQELQDHEDTQLSSIYLFLMGYAIENLLKGILILRHPEYFKPTGEMTSIGTHKLVSLCQRCGIQLLDEESTLLDKLTTYIRWAGRYPVPLDIQDMPPINPSSGDSSWIRSEGGAFHPPKIYGRVESLYVKIWNEFERIQKASSTDT